MVNIIRSTHCVTAFAFLCACVCVCVCVCVCMRACMRACVRAFAIINYAVSCTG